MSAIRVCSLATLARQESFGANWLFSIVAADTLEALRTPAWIPAEQHEIFCFSDVNNPEAPDAPSRADIERLVTLGQALAAPAADNTILIHCQAGISRSPAAAYIFLCIQLGPGREREAIEETAGCCEAPWICPNTLMVRYADDILGRDGKMVDTLAAWQRSIQPPWAGGIAVPLDEPPPEARGPDTG